MSEPQLHTTQDQLTDHLTLKRHTPSPSPQVAELPQLPQLKSRTFNVGIKAKSLPALRGAISGQNLLVRTRSVALGKNKTGQERRAELLKGFSRELLGFRRKGKEDEPAELEEENSGDSRTSLRVAEGRQYPEETPAQSDSTGFELSLHDDIQEEDSGRRPGWEGGRPEGEGQITSTKEGLHSELHPPKLKVVHIRRTDTGFNHIWIASKPVATELEKPGVLEIESEFIDGPAGALEPVKEIRAAPVNPMRPYTDEELKILECMEARVKYLSNPRFPAKKEVIKRILSEGHKVPQFIPPGAPKHLTATADALSVVNPAAEASERNAGIIAIPGSVFFTDYQPHHTYEKDVIIKNTTQNSRRFRLSAPPPYTHSPFFSVTLIEAPADHGTNGLVAPGMSLRYKVIFKPNSLANFSQRFIVSTEMGAIFDVPVIAKREAPLLTLPKTLDCGPSRASYENIRVWDFKNEGGPGRFLIVPDHTEVDPFTAFDNLKESQLYAMASHGPFAIFPSFFEVKNGDTGQIIVRYSPPDFEEEDKEEMGRHDKVVFKLICDNCQVSELPIVGLAQNPAIQVAGIQLPDSGRVEGDAFSQSTDCDVSLDFEAQNPHAKTTYLLTLRNRTLLRLPFTWDLFDIPAHTKPKGVSALQSKTAFQIVPPRGWLPPNEDMTFEVIFKPDGIVHYDVIGNLLLLHNSKRLTEKTVCDSRRKYCSETEDCALSIRCIGQGVPFNAHLDPPILLIPDTLYTGTSYTTSFQLSNMSVSNIAYEWEIENVKSGSMQIALTHPSGNLEALACCAISVQCTGGFPDDIAGALVCKIAHGPTLRVPLAAKVDLPPGSLQFDTDLVDFGLLALGSCKTVQVPLVSRAPVPLSWRITGYKRSCGDLEKDCYLMYHPCEGILEPGSMQKITITYVPVWCQRFRGVLECQIVDADPLAKASTVMDKRDSEPTDASNAGQAVRRTVTATVVEMRAEVLTPRATIMNPLNSITCYVDVPFRYVLVMKNVTMLSAKFKWQNIKTKDYHVTFRPLAGEIPGGEDLEITVEVIAHRIGMLSDLLLACTVEGMVEHGGLLGAKLDLTVRGIEVVFDLQNGSQHKTDRAIDGSSMLFDFGTECPIFANRNGTLVIRNRSAISSPYRVWMEKYAATALKEEEETEVAEQSADEQPVSGPTERRLSMSTVDSSSARGLLRASKPAKLGFSSKTGMEYISKIKEVRRLIRRMHLLLREGRGVAFHASPSSGIIEPWGTVRVQVTSYNNLVGTYEDNLTCEVSGWARQVFPIRLGVVGLPVRFAGAQLVASKRDTPDSMDRVNFGTRITNLTWTSPDGVRVYPRENQSGQGSIEGEAYSKTIQIENQSPRDIVLNWVVYIKHTPLGSPTPTPEEILVPENLLDKDAAGIFGVTPESLLIHAFKTTSIRLFFRSAKVGAFDAIVVADVGYIQPNGKVLYGQGRPNASSDKSKPAVTPPISVAHLLTLARLHIQGGAIEPRLSLDQGDHIRIKQSLWHVRQMSTAPGVLGRTVNVFLKNHSDAVCSFKMEAIPKGVFMVTAAEGSPSVKPNLVRREMKGDKRTSQISKTGRRGHTDISDNGIDDLNENLLELKPTQQLLISVQYIPSSTQASEQRCSTWDVAKPLLAKRTSTSPRPSAVVQTEQKLSLPQGRAMEFMNDDREETLTKPVVSDGQTIQEPDAQESLASPDAVTEEPPSADSASSSTETAGTVSGPPNTEEYPSEENMIKLPGAPEDAGEATKIGSLWDESNPLAGASATGSMTLPMMLPITGRDSTASADMVNEVNASAVMSARPPTAAGVERPLSTTGAIGHNSNTALANGDFIDSSTLIPSISPQPDKPTSTAGQSRLHLIAEGELRIIFTNGMVQSIPIVVEETN
ncbi:hypothetical protein SpCBS45565_g06644 [Spizellomyces sp. 'palustris']|nr:hypothetical protein SpCBS45565_g06644 [Spizellomyces sp. 'palustris']